jgi:hypothetical protein
MKRLLGIALLVGSLSLPAFAAKNAQNITLWQATKIGASQLPAGNYKVTWTGTDSNVQVTVAQGKKTVATVSGKLVPANNNAAGGLSTDTQNGVVVLQSIQLSKFDLVLTSPESSGQ